MSDLPFSKPLVQYASQTNRRNPISSGNIALLRSLNRADLSGRELSQMISNDPAITARVLRVANSSYYGIPNRVSTINHATSLLGVEQVRILVQAFCFSEACGRVSPKEQIFEPRQFAAHSLIVSLLAGRLAKHFGFQLLGKGEAETGGLLHDIGKSVLATDTQISSREIRKVIRNHRPIQEENSQHENSLLQSEKKILGFTHAELGAWLATDWNLPSGVQEAIFYSHDSIGECIHKEWPTVITMADHLANTFEMTCLPTTSDQQVDDSIPQFLESQGKLPLYKALPDVLLKEIELLKDLYMLIAVGTAHIEEPETAPHVESVREPESSRIRTQPHPHPVPTPPSPSQWWEFFPGFAQIERGQYLLGGTWMAVFFVLLMVLMFSLLMGMWGMATLSGMAVVLTWCVGLFMS